MAPTPHRARPLLLVSIAATALAAGLYGFAQEPGAAIAPAEPGVAKLRPFVVGQSQCMNCHGHPENYTDEQKRVMLCRMTESKQWNEHDKHKNAYNVLADSRGRAIGERLGIKASESSACLSCHSVPSGPDIQKDFSWQKTEGVSCVACHGAYAEWVGRHQLPSFPDWRRLSRKQKQAQFGMTDLWDPVTRSKTCASCHIGNGSDGKVVTHAMYAAGHPPLPAFEAATFSEAQPRHWEYLREKKTKPEVVKDLQFNPKKREQTELVVVSGIVVLAESMKLFVAQAEHDGLVKEPATHWPDYARFDCSACHHDLQHHGLQAVSWRQARGFNGSPGRPFTPTWPDVLVKLGIFVADPDGKKGKLEEFERGVEAYVTAVRSRPFGNRGNAIKAARALADWAVAMENELSNKIEDPSKVVIDRELSFRLLNRLVELSQAQYLDYDSARQVAWAFQAIYREAIEIDPDAAPDQDVDRILKTLDEQFTISLPSAGKPDLIEKTLMPRLAAIANFDPAQFQRLFAELGRHLGPR